MFSLFDVNVRSTAKEALGTKLVLDITRIFWTTQQNRSPPSWQWTNKSPHQPKVRFPQPPRDRGVDTFAPRNVFSARLRTIAYHRREHKSLVRQIRLSWLHTLMLRDDAALTKEVVSPPLFTYGEATPLPLFDCVMSSLSTCFTSVCFYLDTWTRALSTTLCCDTTTGSENTLFSP